MVELGGISRDWRVAAVEHGLHLEEPKLGVMDPEGRKLHGDQIDSNAIINNRAGRRRCIGVIVHEGLELIRGEDYICLRRNRLEAWRGTCLSLRSSSPQGISSGHLKKNIPSGRKNGNRVPKGLVCKIYNVQEMLQVGSPICRELAGMNVEDETINRLVKRIEEILVLI